MSWTKSDNATLNINLRRFLNKLSRNTDVPIHVTSGFRSPEEQARVVCKNTKRENEANLSVYSEEEADVYRNNCDTEEGFDKIVEYLKAKGPKSHGLGNHLDIRIRDLTDSQKSELRDVIESMGGKVLEEFSPPHFHVTIPESMHIPAAAGTGALAAGLKSKLTSWKRDTFNESALERAANKIFIDPECTLTRDHFRVIKEEVLNIDILVKVIKAFLSILKIDFSMFDGKIEDLIMSNLQKEKDQEDFSLYNIKKNKMKILKRFQEEGLCIPRMVRKKTLKEINYFDDIRYNEDLFNKFDQALISVESNDNFNAFGSYGEIGRRQILFPNWINWMKTYKDIDVYESISSEEERSKLKEYYNNYKSKGNSKTDKEEAYAAGQILKEVSEINEETENEIAEEVLKRYMEESRSEEGKVDWFMVACKWNTGSMNCSEDNQYANKVLSKMKELTKEASETLLMKKISYSSGKYLLKKANLLDRKGKFIHSDKLEKEAERLLSRI
jgi:hypothetical protein